MNTKYLTIMAFLGGGIGSSLRYLLGIYIKTPYGTLLVNVIGCLIAGLFLSDKLTVIHSNFKIDNQSLKILVFTGICGGLTTFSSFTVESFNLIQSNNLLHAFAYVLFSIALGFLAFYIAYK